MKTLSKIFFLAIALISFGASASAQSISEEEMIRRRAAEKVGQMNSYITDMASKSNSERSRKYYMDKALKLFIGKGYEYTENGVKKEGVMMETTSTNNKTVSRKLMRTYFNNLIKLNYQQVKITSTEIADIKVSRLKKIGDNLYECTCEYVQNFMGYRDGKMVYGDRTTKQIKCYVEAEDTEDGTEYIIMLGDVKATDTQKL